MGLDTESNLSLWRDTAMVEVNKAVLYSFQVRSKNSIFHNSIQKMGRDLKKSPTAR